MIRTAAPVHKWPHKFQCGQLAAEFLAVTVLHPAVDFPRPRKVEPKPGADAATATARAVNRAAGGVGEIDGGRSRNSIRVTRDCAAAIDSLHSEYPEPQLPPQKRRDGDDVVAVRGDAAGSDDVVNIKPAARKKRCVVEHPP
jgi:hypothetical protein